MAQESSFFNAELINGSYDRVYNAENWAAYFASFLSNGIAYTAKNTLLVEASTGMEVLVNTGIAFINGYRYANTTPLAISINPANSTYSRITSIVIELNLNTRNILIKTLDGEPSPNPVAPTLIKTSGVYQLQLATVLVQAGVSNIASGNITDTRSNPTVCGWLGLLMEETNEESQTLQSEISAASKNIANINSMLNINSENNSLNLGSTNFNNTVVINDALQINEQNGFITFENSTGKDIMDIQVNTDTFVLENAITNNELLSVTPVTTGTDTMQVICNTQIEGNSNFEGISTFNNTATINNNFEISETGSLIFQNTEGKNIMCLQVDIDNDINSFVLQNAITNNELLLVTPVSSGTDTLEVICNIEVEGNTNFEGNPTFNSIAVVNNELQVTEKNGFIAFTNTEGTNIVQVQVNNDQFVIENSQTGNNLVQVTPVSSGTDTLQVICNTQLEGNNNFQGTSTFNSTAIVNDELNITEQNGFITFENSEGQRIMNLQVNTDTFTLQNGITNNGLFNVTPVKDGIDTLQMLANVNFSSSGVLQVSGEQIWNGGNAASNPAQLSGQFVLSNSGGQYLNYNIQYWTMSMGGVVNSTTPPQCGIGVITVQLTPCSNNVDWSGQLSLTYNDNNLPGISGLQTMMINQNPEFTLELNQEIEALLLNNINIVPNTNSNTPNTYTATAIILN